ncbi:MAG TPA: hypothetical protein VFV38_17145 [Ktedonobacteraceae bacterium]|nr:hypothetical protein [Ktedonobacteraceae bacterium]
MTRDVARTGVKRGGVGTGRHTRALVPEAGRAVEAGNGMISLPRRAFFHILLAYLLEPDRMLR